MIPDLFRITVALRADNDHGVWLGGLTRDSTSADTADSCRTRRDGLSRIDGSSLLAKILLFHIFIITIDELIFKLIQ